MLQSGPAVNPLLAKLSVGLDQAFHKKKQEGEFMRRKLAELASLPAAEQVTRLKMMINEQESQQKMLQTRALKSEKEAERAAKRLIDAQNVKPQSDNVQAGSS